MGSDETTFVTLPAIPLTGESDRTLLNLAILGDHGSFFTLFQRYGGDLWRLAFYVLHSAPEADEAVQDTYTKSLGHLDTFSSRQEPATWLFRKTLEACRWILQPREVHPVSVRQAATVNYRRRYSRRIAVTLGHLSDTQREIFVLHFIGNLPYADCAAILEMDLPTVKSLADRAKEIMWAKLGPHHALLKKT